MSKLSVERCLFLVCALVGAGIFWIGHHPTGIDFAQHAAQISLMGDMFRGNSPWAEQLRWNLATPYLIGYGLAFPLSLFLGVASALKLMLSLAYLGFVFMGVQMRRHFQADRRLDWLFLLGFFGYPAYWGFFTFLVSAPLVFLFIIASDRYARTLSLGRAAGVVAAGLVLVVSHGLAFAFAGLVGASLLLAYRHGWKSRMVSVLPFLLLLIPFGFFVLVSRRMKLEMFGSLTSNPNVWDFGAERLLRTLIYTIGGTPEAWVAAIALLILAAPWAMGLRIAVCEPARWIPFAVTALVVLAAPESALDTGGIYSRYTIFVLPTYLLMFARPARGASRLPPAVPQFLLVGLCALLLAVHAWRERKFDLEEADFRAVVEKLEPGQRALSLVFDRMSPATQHRSTYVHQPLWYQAEKQGFVDFNFAWFPPQLIRYRAGILPVVGPGFEFSPEDFEWERHRGEQYRYFIVRRGPKMPEALFKDAPCRPASLVESGSWIVYENRPCR